VGTILKSLGFITDKLSAYGRGLRLTPKVKRKIHDLLRSYGLKPNDPRTDSCAFCEEAFPTDRSAPAVQPRRKRMKPQPEMNM
jgi:hypothetical protein